MKLFKLTLCFFLALPALSQQHYHFVETTSPYSDLVDPITDPDVIIGEDFLFYLAELEGETFNFFGEDFTFSGADVYFGLRTIGNLRINGATNIVIIDGLWTVFESFDETTEMSWAVEGSSGEYIVTAQWKNASIEHGPEENYVNFQMKVYQETGIIEFHYGPASANSLDGYSEEDGPYIGILYANEAFTTIHQTLWLSEDPTDVTVDTSGTSLDRMHGVPAEGTLYRFIPKHLTVGLEDKKTISNLNVYPNPAQNKVFISGADQTEINSVSIYTISGNLVINSITDTDFVDVSALAEGNYLIRIKTTSGIYTEKLTIKR